MPPKIPVYQILSSRSEPEFITKLNAAAKDGWGVVQVLVISPSVASGTVFYALIMKEQ